MLGIDKTTISRFKNPTNEFIEKVLHPLEIKEYQATENKERYLAARWAIKEALFKANNSNFAFSKIRIEKIDSRYVYQDYEISTTSEGDEYIAIVMKEGK